MGQSREFHPFISKKIDLTDADAVAFYTKGIWEHIDEGELSDAFESSNRTTGIGGQCEDLLLSRQPEHLGKYTFVTIFINKILRVQIKSAGYAEFL